MDLNQTRLIGDYILGPIIGRGSFAVVRRAKHRCSCLEVAVKEIDKKLLSPKVSDNLLKEISILSTINHPNIIRLFESIETEDKIFLVLEYCDGGDLAGYIQRHGKVTEAVARHFMRQLAAGLQALQEKYLIHRDLKPQNLLLLSNDLTPQLKIGDFGFARSLTSSDLADTLCGSPLYMAPEIIQNKKYDAKADLWSVGAVLFQLVTGKPPFDGNSQYQLFQNILTSTELRFPQGALEELHPDCVDLCRSLLCRNPVERLTFKEFFNHKFLEEPRLLLDAKSPLLPQMKSVVEQFDASASNTRSQMEHCLHSANRNAILTSTSEHDNITMLAKVHDRTSRNDSVHGIVPSIVHDRMGRSAYGSQSSLDQLRVADLMESLEKDYVIVNRHFSSMENFSYYLETSLQDSSTSKSSVQLPQKNNQDMVVAIQTEAFTGSSVSSANDPQVHGSEPLTASCVPNILREVQGLPIPHPSIKLHFLNQYAQAIVELAQEKYDSGMFLESFSVELVVLAIWKKVLEICNHWVASNEGSELPESSSANESTFVHGGIDLIPLASGKMDFIEPSSAYKWAEKSFILAFDRTEKLSHNLRHMDAAAEMPDAMELIFQEALAVGRSGAVDEYMENKGGADVSYSKAMLLLHFIAEEATSLPLKPPFSLTSACRKRIQSYILNLQSHRSHFSMLQPIPEQSPDSHTK
ncbi:serine/threonine-protein kinase ATG1a-like [Populus nigra]|uniref:serine/threonine-protein kinase ATG1a-like n=1 Tax=Populus nigra TaxID=3691 RepID=UPI002B267652|nr:serine/threonine-protein kinase ATG1a-like [Populus nigra]